MSGVNNLIRIPRDSYIHVLDQNLNLTRLVEGPLTYVRQDNEKVVLEPTKMIAIPPRSYCEIVNPIVRDENDEVVYYKGQVKLRHAEREIRLHRDPFALYPGEVATQIKQLPMVPDNAALRLFALNDCVNAQTGKAYKAGEEFYFTGPGVYSPHVDIEVKETVKGTVINPNQALRLKAVKNTISKDGKQRVSGEEWIVEEVGSYLPGVFEKVVGIIKSQTLTDKTALHLKSCKTFTDTFGKVREAGSEWLVTVNDTESYLPSVYETVVDTVKITTLNRRQYCVILNPMENGKIRLGAKKLIVGEESFFLQPGESFHKISHPGGPPRPIQNVFVLSEYDGLVLRALETFKDGDVVRTSGSKWMIKGPAEYVPPVEVEIVNKRKAIPLDENEGVYVKDILTGSVRAVCGQTYMLNENEELWNKVLSESVEKIVSSDVDPLADRSVFGKKRKPSIIERDQSKVVTYRVPHNAAIQIFNYKQNKARIVFGPDLVMLGPEEEFVELSLSAGKPKEADRIRSLCLLLGPDFCTDIIIVETADHAKLQLQLAYNWHFDIPDKNNLAETEKLFSIPDFIGDSCKTVASLVRGACASVKFDDFHKNSSQIIKEAVFGVQEDGQIGEELRFSTNNLCITSIDIQSVEPVHQRTRDALQQSVTLAIQITTESQKSYADQEARRLEQEAKGGLAKQEIVHLKANEAERKNLLDLQARSIEVEAVGRARAEALSIVQSAEIEGRSAVTQATLKAKTTQIEAETELYRISSTREAEMAQLEKTNALEIAKAQELSEIEIKKFKQQVKAIGADTIMAMAKAGPEMQAKLLSGLGIQSTLITDGSSPLNLFQAANGLIENKTA